MTSSTALFLAVCCHCINFSIKFQNFFPSLTKIVGTLGPRSRSVETLEACLKAGMSGLSSFSCIYWLELCYYYVSWFSFMWLNCSCYTIFVSQVARFDFSWSNAEYHQETLDNLRIAVSNIKKPCAVSEYPTSFLHLW